MNIFVLKWSKIAAQKKVFFCWFCLGPPSYGIGTAVLRSASVERCFVSRMRDFFLINVKKNSCFLFKNPYRFLHFWKLFWIFRFVATFYIFNSTQYYLPPSLVMLRGPNLRSVSLNVNHWIRLNISTRR